MKKNFTIKCLLASLVFMMLCPVAVFAQMDSKEIERTVKVRKKALKKNKEIVDASGAGVDYDLYRYIDKLENGNYEPIEGKAKCRSTNVCKQTAFNNAQILYAQQVNGKVQGAVATIQKSDASMPKEEIDKTISAFTKEVEANVGGIMKIYYSTYKEKDGVKEYTVYCLIDKDAEAKYIKSALESSIQETKLTIEQAKSITKFVSDELLGNKE